MKTIRQRKLQPKCELGERLLRLCEAKGHKSLAEAAHVSGLNYMQLYRMMTGRLNPQLTTIQRIVTALGSNLDEFFEPVSCRKDV